LCLPCPILVGLDRRAQDVEEPGQLHRHHRELRIRCVGKLMSISDKLMWSYYELLTDFTSPVIVRLQEEVNMGVLHPMDAKDATCATIVAGFHGEEAPKKLLTNSDWSIATEKLLQILPEMKLAWGTAAAVAAF